MKYTGFRLELFILMVSGPYTLKSWETAWEPAGKILTFEFYCNECAHKNSIT